MPISRSRWLLLFILGLLAVLLNPFISFLVNKISDRYQWEAIPDWSVIAITVAVVLLGGLVVWIIAELQKNLGSAADLQYSAERRLEKARRKTLQEAEKRVTRRLGDSLHSDWLWPLNLRPDMDQVGLLRRSQGVVVRAGDMPELRSQEPIINIFQHPKIQGELLILGDAGSGKTTTLLDLARVLISAAQRDETKPLPLLFSLSSWQNDKQSIANWLESQLNQDYGVAPEIAKQWVQEQEVLPLLDGLDEVAPHRQKLCVEKINEYLDSASLCPAGIVVCSRIKDFERYSQEIQPNLNGAIRLEPFLDSDIEIICQRLEYPELWHGLCQSSPLLELVRTPLFLSMAILAVKNDLQKIRGWQDCQTDKARQRFLFSAYIDTKLDPKAITTHYYGRHWWQPKQPPTKQQTLIWLKWLAQTLRKQRIAEFYIEKMQLFVLTDIQRQQHTVASGLLLGMISGLFSGLIGIFWGWIGFSIGLTIGLSFGFFLIMLFYNSSEEDLLLLEALRFPFSYEARLNFTRNLIKGLQLGGIFGLALGLLAGLALGMLGAFSSIGFNPLPFIQEMPSGLVLGTTGLVFGTVFGLSVGLLTGLLVGFQAPEDIIIRKKPNQGIWNSIRNSIALCFFFYPIAFFIWAVPSLCHAFIADNVESIELSGWLLPSFFISALLAIYLGGGFGCLQHFLLRCILYRYGSIPWHYARFLQYAAEQRLLQQVGGSFLFMHDLLREHIAEELT